MTSAARNNGTHDMTGVDVAGESDPEVISRQIDHTREAMAGTLDEIQRRLEPEQVSSYVKDVAYYMVLELKALARDFAGEAMTNVRAAAPKTSIGASNQDARETPRLPASTRAFLARYTGSQSGTKAGQMVNQTQGFWKKLEANPLALGAAGIALGSIVGAIAPRLQQEDQLMGEARDQVMENLQATAGQTIESIREAAVETGTAVMKEATSSSSSVGE
jgi:hypothetical protein